MHAEASGRTKWIRIIAMGLLPFLLVAGLMFVALRNDWFPGDSGSTSSDAEGLGTEWPGLVYEEVTRDTFSQKVVQATGEQVVLIADPTEKSEALQSLTDTVDMIMDQKLKVFYIRDQADEDFWDQWTVADLRSGQYRINLAEKPLLAMFSNGQLLGYRRLLITEDDAVTWLIRTRPKDPTPIPPTSGPTPTPTMGATLYRPFQRYMFDTLDTSSSNGYYIGELILLPRSLSLVNSILSGSITSMKINDNTALYSLMGKTFGGTVDTFGIPDLSSQVPIAGLNYFIVERGYFPPRGETAQASVIVGDVKYIPTPVDWISDEFFTGSVVLGKNLTEDQGLRYLLPCDGRLLDARLEPTLYSILGNRFGGEKDKTFRLPDLNSGVMPVEGAKFYIITQGIYPTGK
jgi:microcystin-dependent protein